MSGPDGHGHWKVIYDGPEDKDKEDKQSDDEEILARTLSEPKSMCILSDAKTEMSTVTELHPPKLKLPQLASDTTERVFPIRSILSFDSNPSSALQTPSLDKLETAFSPFTDALKKNGTIGVGSIKRPNYLARMRKERGSYSGVSPSLSIVPTLDNPFPESMSSSPNRCGSPETPSLQEQLQQTILEGGRILDISGKAAGLQYSHEDEFETLIQPFGALLVICESGDTLTAQVASSNSKEILGYTPDELFELESICSILPGSQQSIFLSHVRFVLNDEYDVKISGPEIFDLSIATVVDETKRVWCTMHTSNTYKNYVICELELELEPGIESTRETMPHESFKSGEIGDLNESKNPDQRRATLDSELLNVLPRILQQTASAQSLNVLVQHAILTIQQLTQFDRVSMFHFDGDRNGLVIADAVDPSLDLESCGGIHFEESVFPDDVKRRYLRSPVSLSYQKRSETAELVYRVSTNRLGLDLSHCYLPVASETTKDMSQPMKACISIGSYVFGKLWGLISCQSYDADLQLHPLLQKVCWFMSVAVSSNIERLSYTLPFQLQEQNASPEHTNSDNVKCPSGDLLCLFGADYAAASTLGEIKILGRPFDSQEVLALLEYLRAKELDTVLWSTNILSDFEDLDYSPGFRHLSGLLYIPLSADGHDFIIFFRSDNQNENRQSLAGVPQNGLDKPNRQAEWSAAEFGKASILSLLYRTFSEIWQEKEAAMQNNQLMRLLLANSAHEFRTPLNAIINYLEMALDGSLNQETRENLSRSHSASKSLVYIINDLLDLTNTENGQRLIKDELFSLSETLCEATDIFWEEARQKHVDLQVVQHDALPPVLGDQRRVRQVITNLISNAIQHTSSGAVTIESCVPSECWKPEHITVEVAVHDTGSGMSSETVETLFCELEQVSNSGYMRNPKYGNDAKDSTTETESVLGLGLALVARMVRNMNGQLSLRSEEGKGSCFKIRLNFPLPGEKESHDTSQKASKEDCASGQIDNIQRPNNAPEGDQTSCEACQSKSDDRQKPNEVVGSEGIHCRCGDEALPPQTFLDVDISLKSGESRDFALPIHKEKGPNESSPTPTSKTSTKGTADPKPHDASTEMPQQPSELRILVAEDDPVNSAIVQKRLEKLGHVVHLTRNGKECTTMYFDFPRCFHAILMDLQV